MNKVLVLFTLVLGYLVTTNNAEAAVVNNNIFKGMNSLQNNPWDPRTGEEADKERDSSGREALPEPESEESETEE
jgi:hypothetical protein